MAGFKKTTFLIGSLLLILGGIQGCSKSDESQDLSTTQAVITKIKSETQIPEEMVVVETKDGKVILTGNVDTADQEKQLITITESVEGVKSVESKLVLKETATVKEEIPVPAPQANTPTNKPEESQAPTQGEPAAPTSMPNEPKQDTAPGADMQSSSTTTITQPPANIEDVAVTARVKSLLTADPAYQNVTVDTQSGVVTISGTVNTQTDADSMVKKVEAIEGVKKVDSKVTVKPAA